MRPARSWPCQIITAFSWPYANGHYGNRVLKRTLDTLVPLSRLRLSFYGYIDVTDSSNRTIARCCLRQLAIFLFPEIESRLFLSLFLLRFPR